MKRIVLSMLLVATASAVAQTASSPTPAAPQQGAAPAPAPQKKEIKDPAEYNAYMGALGQQDNAAKISGLEAFLTQYPNSVMKEDALELLMGSYQQAGNSPKTMDTAQKVLQANPCNLRALALLAYTKRAMAEAGGAGAAQNLTEAGQYGERGLQCEQTVVKPDGTSDADFQKLKTQTAIIFNGAAGMAAYSAKDYGKAEQYLRASVEGDPTNLRDVYPLALAYLAPGATEKDVDGLFFIARAANLAQGAGKDQIAKFGKSKYTKYHGSDEGWNDVLAKTATTTLPTSDFTIKQYIPPTPADQCADLVKSKKVEEMNFAEWELCLSEGKPEDSDKVWTALKGKSLRMVAQVMSVDSAKLLKLAGSSDDIDAKRADVELNFAAAIPKAQLPKEGANLDFEGTPVSFVAKPFVVTMNDGALVVKAAPKAPARKKPVQ
jgi:tetratricopeptide (TPR) repeat protein